MKSTPRKKALDALQKLVRVKAADHNGFCRCVTCGGQWHWSEMDGGHYIPKGASSYWAIQEINVNPQCKYCNGFGMKHNTTTQQYTLWMIDNHGREWVDHMEEIKKTISKHSKKDYEEMLLDWNEEIKQHLERIGQSVE